MVQLIGQSVQKVSAITILLQLLPYLFYGKIYLACCIRYHADHTVPLLGEDIVVIVDKKAKLIVIVPWLARW
jgi:hypothetical protein